MKLVIDTDTLTHEQATETLRRVYGDQLARPEAEPSVRPPYLGKLVLEPLPDICRLPTQKGRRA